MAMHSTVLRWCTRQAAAQPVTLNRLPSVLPAHGTITTTYCLGCKRAGELLTSGTRAEVAHQIHVLLLSATVNILTSVRRIVALVCFSSCALYNRTSNVASDGRGEPLDPEAMSRAVKQPVGRCCYVYALVAMLRLQLTDHIASSNSTISSASAQPAAHNQNLIQQ